MFPEDTFDKNGQNKRVGGLDKKKEVEICQPKRKKEDAPMQ